MTRVRLEDLDPKVRDRVIDALANDLKAKTSKRDRTGVGDAAPCPGHCHNCGAAFPTATAWERHAIADHEGNARWEIDAYTIPHGPPQPPESSS